MKAHMRSLDSNLFENYQESKVIEEEDVVNYNNIKRFEMFNVKKASTSTLNDSSVLMMPPKLNMEDLLDS